jgi:hypothetical protein
VRCLFVDKRRGEEKDKGGKRTKSSNREEVSAEVTDSGGDHVGRSGSCAEVSHVLDHVNLGSFSCEEGRADCNAMKRELMSQTSAMNLL